MVVESTGLVCFASDRVVDMLDGEKIKQIQTHSGTGKSVSHSFFVVSQQREFEGMPQRECQPSTPCRMPPGPHASQNVPQESSAAPPDVQVKVRCLAMCLKNHQLDVCHHVQVKCQCLAKNHRLHMC